MHFYYVSDGATTPRYCGTLAEAHSAAKQFYSRRMVDITLVDIGTDKENLLRILNNEGGYESAQLRRWDLTPRGGLKEVSPNEEE